jgi:hypothetical protein
MARLAYVCVRVQQGTSMARWVECRMLAVHGEPHAEMLRLFPSLRLCGLDDERTWARTAATFPPLFLRPLTEWLRLVGQR